MEAHAKCVVNPTHQQATPNPSNVSQMILLLREIEIINQNHIHNQRLGDLRMPSALDVAAHVLEHCGPMTAMKLQKLVYYCQAWSIVWDDDALFPEEIEAWKNGPVVRELWDVHRGQFRVEKIAGGNAKGFNNDQSDTVKEVLKVYGPHSAQWLSDLTHMEDPWKDAWAQGPSTVITKESLAEYYSSIEPPSEQEA
jgi:uncharacterized phage-associated protein